MIRAGQKLKEQRIAKGLSIEEASKETKIKASYLLAIEKGEYKRLPASTYTQGFVRNYAKYLGLSEQEILAIFRREFDEEKTFKVLPEGLVKEDFSIKKIKLADAVKIMIPLFLILLFYILFQYRFAIISPPLEVLSPVEGAVVLSRTVTVSGKTDPNATIFVNSETASLDSDGNFKKVINVFPGKTTIKVKAINRFGKEKIIERHIEVKR
jgi:cytoskeletal protein RodZ